MCGHGQPLASTCRNHFRCGRPRRKTEFDLSSSISHVMMKSSLRQNDGLIRGQRLVANRVSTTLCWLMKRRIQKEAMSTNDPVWMENVFGWPLWGNSDSLYAQFSCHLTRNLHRLTVSPVEVIPLSSFQQTNWKYKMAQSPRDYWVTICRRTMCCNMISATYITYERNRGCLTIVKNMSVL